MRDFITMWRNRRFVKKMEAKRLEALRVRDELNRRTDMLILSSRCWD